MIFWEETWWDAFFLSLGEWQLFYQGETTEALHQLNYSSLWLSQHHMCTQRQQEAGSNMGKDWIALHCLPFKIVLFERLQVLDQRTPVMVPLSPGESGAESSCSKSSQAGVVPQEQCSPGRSEVQVDQESGSGRHIRMWKLLQREKNRWWVLMTHQDRLSRLTSGEKHWKSFGL